jgi:diguanylate cyclase (GGDEF)-like protein
MMDLDHFKMINDNYGHSAGDLTLNSAAQFIMSRLRESDLFCRYGGEEFLLLLPDTDQDGAAVVAEELRKGLAGLRLENTNKCFFITASFGVAEKQPADTSVVEVLIRADQALYRAKDEGRNRVCRASNASATPKDDEAAKWSEDF